MDVIKNTLNEQKNTWQHFLPLVLLSLFIALFFSTFHGLFVRWIKWDEGLSHGLLVNAVFIYFLYKSLPWQIEKNSRFISLLGLIGLTIASLSWFVFHLANIYLFEELLLLVLLAGFYGCIYGLRTIFNYRLLLILPIFTIPLWEQFNDYLVALSSFAVGQMVQFIEMPAVIEGNSIFIPFGHIVIADGCSGLRYLEIALVLGFIISLLNNYTEKRLIPTLIIAALLGLLANWIRIFALVIIGYETKMQSSLMANHEFFGWILFGAMCFPAIYFAPIVKKAAETKTTHTGPFKLSPLPFIALSLGPLLTLFISSEPVIADLKHLIPVNQEIIIASKMPVMVTAPDKPFKEIAQTETAQGNIFIEIDQYQRINSSDKLVPYINRLFENELWTADNATVVINAHSATLTEFHQKNSDRAVMQLQWYDVGGYKTHSLARAKLLQIPALIMGANHFKIITLQSPCVNGECESAKALLSSTSLPLLSTLHQ